MNLQIIKTKAEQSHYPGGLKALAKAVGMTVQNLHRCVRDNKMQAQDLERIASELKVSIGEFFDEKCTSVHAERACSPASDSGDVSVIIGDALIAEKVKYLEAILIEKDERIKALEALLEEKERLIQILLKDK